MLPAAGCVQRGWMLWGHSQGRRAALPSLSPQVHQPEPGYLGAVVSSPAVDLTQALIHRLPHPGRAGSWR